MLRFEAGVAELRRLFEEVKDRGLNNLPTQLEERNHAIVPFGQDLIKNDAHVFFEIVSHFPSGFINLINNMYKGF
jgi:hypothetical protein